MKTFNFDVMIGDKFFCSMRFPYCPLHPIPHEELEKFILKNRPILRHYKYHIEF